MFQGRAQPRRAAWGQVVAKLQNMAWPGGATARPLILESWRRCWDAGLDPDAPITLRRIDLPELLQRQAANRALLTVAPELIDRFSAAMAALKHVIYMTDADGIVLYSRGTDFLMQSYGLRPGFDWSEAAMGTNGAGTALASNSPVAVIGPDHWMSPFRGASCLGAPIRTASGSPVAAVDLSTSAEECDPAHLEEVIALAAAIEAARRPS